MKILSIDTASDLCTVAVLENTSCIKEIIVDDARNHSEKIMPIIEQVLKETNMQLKDIDLIVCDKGPGSFTGIRIGVGTVLGFRDSLNINCIGVSSLEALVYNVKHDGMVCSLIDAKNNNVYYSLFEHSKNKYTQIGNYLFDNISNITEILKNCNKPIFFVGNGSIVYKDVLESNLYKNAIFANNETYNKLNATNVAKAAFDAFCSGEYTDEKYSLSPLYLRKSSAQIQLEEKQQNGNINK